jgi:hypothetical protein
MAERFALDMAGACKAISSMPGPQRPKVRDISDVAVVAAANEQIVAACCCNALGLYSIELSWTEKDNGQSLSA